MLSPGKTAPGPRLFHGVFLLTLLGALALVPLGSAVPTAKLTAGDGKGIVVEGVAPVGLASEGNSALFVGVNEFEDQSLRALRFAVNDAVAQAHLFVLELKLFPVANAVVMLSGEPSTAATRSQLQQLKAAGVRVDKASRAKLLNELARAVAVPQDKADLVVISLSSHGFEEDGVPYVMPADGTRAFLSDTGFKLKTVEDRLARSKAGKRLLIVDACREKATGDDKSLGSSMDKAWRDALASASGQAVLASCDVGQFSFEDVKLGHGVFTYHLLAALNGKAAADARGHITLGAVSDHVSRAVNEWVARNKVGSTAESAQKPWFKGPNDAREMPLAVSKAFLENQRAEAALVAQREAMALLAQRELAVRKQTAKERLADAYRAQNSLLGARLLVEIEGGLESWTGQQLEALLEQTYELQNPTVTRVSNFLLWWKSVRSSAIGPAATASAPGSAVVAPPRADTPPASPVTATTPTTIPSANTVAPATPLPLAPPTVAASIPAHTTPAAVTPPTPAPVPSNPLVAPPPAAVVPTPPAITPPPPVTPPAATPASSTTGVVPTVPATTPPPPKPAVTGSSPPLTPPSSPVTPTKPVTPPPPPTIASTPSVTTAPPPAPVTPPPPTPVPATAAVAPSAPSPTPPAPVLTGNTPPAPPAPATAAAPGVSTRGTDTAMQLAISRPLPNPEIAPQTSRPAPAARDRQFLNSLGMKFVPVPGTEVLFSVWETRVKDFQEFSASGHSAGSAWRNPFFKKEPVTPGPNHPVVNVTHQTAKDFCKWLTDKERRDGWIPATATYRLPTDEEWSWAVGIGDKETKGTPAEKSGKLKGIFPWGTAWPPPTGAGNYTDLDSKAKFGTGVFGALTGYIAGYSDGYPTAAPVGSFAPNALGIFDLGGNVAEWCEVWHAGRLTFRVCRGGSWMSNDPMFINASSRFNFPKDLESDDIGFRVVLHGR